MMNVFRALVLLVGLSQLGCAIWQRYDPLVRAPAAGQTVPVEVAFKAALARARALGYSVVERDDTHHFFRVQAALDADRQTFPAWFHTVTVERISYFGVQVNPEALQFFASGYHVHEGEIHYALRQEFEAFAHEMETTTNLATANSLHADSR